MSDQELLTIERHVHKAVMSLEGCAKCGLVTDMWKMIQFAGRNQPMCMNCARTMLYMKLAARREEFFGYRWF